MFSLLNEYLNEIGIHQENLDIICQLLILICSFNYSHELFQREIIKKIENYLKTSKDSELRKDKNKSFSFLIKISFRRKSFVGFEIMFSFNLLFMFK